MAKREVLTRLPLGSPNMDAIGPPGHTYSIPLPIDLATTPTNPEDRHGTRMDPSVGSGR